MSLRLSDHLELMASRSYNEMREVYNKLVEHRAALANELVYTDPTAHSVLNVLQGQILVTDLIIKEHKSVLDAKGAH